MAKSNTRKTSSRATTSKTTEVAEVDIVEEAPGMGWESGVAIITALMLLVAILLVDYQLGRDYGAGAFFK